MWTSVRVNECCHHAYIIYKAVLWYLVSLNLTKKKKRKECLAAHQGRLHYTRSILKVSDISPSKEKLFDIQWELTIPVLCMHENSESSIARQFVLYPRRGQEHGNNARQVNNNP